MSFNFGAFAGGLSTGVQQGVQLAKTYQQIKREKQIQELRDQGMAEAEQQRASAIQSMIKENGTTGQSSSGPVEAPKPAPTGPSEATQLSPEAVATPVKPTQIEATPLDASGARVPGVGASSEGNQGEAEAAADTKRMQAPKAEEKTVQAPQSVQQTVASAGVAKAPTGKFTVNGESFDTREQAQAAAEKAAPTASELFMKNAVPKIAQQYLANGDPATAKAWQDYADSQNGKRAMKDWAAAYTSPDFDTALTRFGKYYTDHINDGVDYTGHEIVTKSDGTQVGVVTLKDRATGKEQKMEMTRESILQLGAANNPQALFEQERQKQAAADKIKLEAQIKAQQRKEDNKDKRDLEAFKQSLIAAREKSRDEALDARESKKLNARIDTQVDALRDAGYSDDEIRGMMPTIVGAGDHKKTTDPTERRALVASDLMKNDPKFARMTPDEQRKKIDDVMSVIYDKGGDAPAPKPGSPAAPAAPQPDENTIYRNTQTGERFRVVNGQKVPVGPAPAAPAQAPAAAPSAQSAPGPAGGLPKTRGATGGW